MACLAALALCSAGPAAQAADLGNAPEKMDAAQMLPAETPAAVLPDDAPVNEILPLETGKRVYDPVKVAAKLRKDLKAKGMRLGAPVFMRIFKMTRELEVWVEQDGAFELFRTYPICAFSGRLGPKLLEGDLQAPEGFYRVDRDLMHPESQWHLAFNLGFPNHYDRSFGRTGSYLMVHGSCGSRGCYAMTDEGIEEIYTLADHALAGGQEAFEVHIFPFPLTRANYQRHRKSLWASFWWNLKTGYDLFERDRLPPKVGINGERKYVFWPGKPAAKKTYTASAGEGDGGAVSGATME